MRPLTQFVAAGAAAIALWACLPFADTFIASPPIVGVYRDASAQPVGGVQLILSTEDADSACAIATLETATDSAGRFSFPSTTGHDPIIILLPIDNLRSYVLCARVTDTLRLAFEGSELHSFGSERDSLFCTQFQAPAERLVRCTLQ